MSNLKRVCRELIIAADLVDNKNFVQGIDIEDPLLSRVRKVARACLVMEEALKICCVGDLAPGEGIYKAEIARDALTQIEEIFK